MNEKRKERLKWWRRFRTTTIISCSVLIVAQCILYLLGYVELVLLCGGILVVFAAIPLTYGVWYIKIRYQTSKTIQLMNRIAFIGVGGWVAWIIAFFGGAFIVWATGLPPPDYLTRWPTFFIVFFVVPWIVGGFIGYLVGKRRNYRPYI